MKSFKQKIKELEIKAKEVCESKGFSEEEIREILIELSIRSVARSFAGMPENLILSLYRHEINHIRDYGALSKQ